MSVELVDSTSSSLNLTSLLFTPCLLAVFSKKLLNVSATFFSFERSLPFSTNDILVWAATLSLKKSWMVLQSSLLLAKLQSLLQNSFCFFYVLKLMLDLSLKFFVSSSVRFTIAFLRVLVIYGTWEALSIFLLIGAYLVRKKQKRLLKKSFSPIRLEFPLIFPSNSL